MTGPVFTSQSFIFFWVWVKLVSKRLSKPVTATTRDELPSQATPSRLQTSSAYFGHQWLVPQPPEGTVALEPNSFFSSRSRPVTGLGWDLLYVPSTAATTAKAVQALQGTGSS